MRTPVALLIFNRPDTTAKVFEAIRQAKPPKLLVIADGARSSHPGEVAKCEAARAIINSVDWDCEVLTNYSEVNLGCGKRPATGITWVFEQVEEAIILEDDCLPHLTFFQFCEELLDKYRHDTRIMTISGTNILNSWKLELQSYHFSYYGSHWGWASWKRAWDYFDYEMKHWSNLEVQKQIANVLCDQAQYQIRKKRFDRVINDQSTWDGRFLFACLLQSGLSIVPASNLIYNIGFNQEATHTKSLDELSHLKLLPMEFPLRHPLGVVVDREYDYKFYQKMFKPKKLIGRVISKFKKIMS